MHFLIPVFEKIANEVNAITIAKQHDLDLRRVRSGLRLLERRGHVTQTRPGIYRLTNAGRSLLKPSKPKVKKVKKHPLPKLTTQRARAWRAMRVLKKFTSTDLIVQISKDDETISYTNISIFLRQLEATGYIVILGSRSRPNRWILVNDAGRYPPVFNYYDRKAYNPNTGETNEY